ncbi:MAG: ComEA family DNA-binding protein [Candidatus Electrothrix sp. YB6]
MRQESSHRDLRLPVLLFLGVIILAAGQYTSEPDSRAGAYYLALSAGQNKDRPELVRISGTEPKHLAGFRKITPDLPCAATPPELALLFNLPLPINRADQDTLTMLPGIGPKLAERIVAFRKKQGDITGPENFIRIRGIGPKRTARLTPLLCFAGTM